MRETSKSFSYVRLRGGGGIFYRHGWGRCVQANSLLLKLLSAVVVVVVIAGVVVSYQCIAIYLLCSRSYSAL